MELLKFQCYEAHIPYTMQFFKDYNLAGMRPVKVGDGRFRDKLPICARPRIVSQVFEEKKLEDENDFFLRGNVNDELMWENASSCDTKMTNHGSINEFWKKKTTCCDLEYDTTGRFR